MQMTYWYEPKINPALHVLRRRVIERMVAAKGLTPGTAKFDMVVMRHLRKVQYHRTCQYDNEIPPAQLRRALQGRPQRETRSRDRGLEVAMERHRAARGKPISSSR